MDVGKGQKSVSRPNSSENGHPDKLTDSSSEVTEHLYSNIEEISAAKEVIYSEPIEARGPGIQRQASRYENVTSFPKRLDDPFGDDFERCLNLAKKVSAETPEESEQSVLRKSSSSTSSRPESRTNRNSSSAESSRDVGASKRLSATSTVSSSSVFADNRDSDVDGPTLTSSSRPQSIVSNQSAPTELVKDCGGVKSLPISLPPKCSRSTSLVSRLSFESNSPDPTSKSFPKYKYDEVHLNSNFNKRVVPEPPKEKVYDIFSSISFSSPLGDIDGGCDNGQISAQIEDFKERNMCSLESEQSSASYREASEEEKTEQIGDHPYEDIEFVRNDLRKKPSRSPDAPPRLPVRRSKTDVHTKTYSNERDNIYSEWKPRKNNGSRGDSLLDRLMMTDSSDSNSKAEVDAVDALTKPLIPPADSISGGQTRQLGARPKVTNKGTIDMRNRINQWYEEAEREVDRDLSLDLTHLEKLTSNLSRSNSRRTQPQSYEHINMAVTGRPLLGSGADSHPAPTRTLLRDFDPCFEEDLSDNERSSSADDDHSRDREMSGFSVPAAPRSRQSVIPQKPTKSAKHSHAKASTKERELAMEDDDKPTFGPAVSSVDDNLAANSGAGGASCPPEASTASPPDSDTSAPSGRRQSTRRSFRQKLLAGFPSTALLATATPKKIKFGGGGEKGPPKPPRSWETINKKSKSSTSLDSDTSLNSKDSVAKEDERVPSNGQNADELASTSDSGGHQMKKDWKNLEFERCRQKKGQEPVENHYVLDPTFQEDQCQDDEVDDIYEEPCLMQPPPLPTSLPPSPEKPAQTMYENVWIDSNGPSVVGEQAVPPARDHQKPLVLPPVPPRKLKPEKNTQTPSVDSGVEMNSHTGAGSDSRSLADSPASRKFSDSSLASWKSARRKGMGLSQTESLDSVDTVSSTSTAGSISGLQLAGSGSGLQFAGSDSTSEGCQASDGRNSGAGGAKAKRFQPGRSLTVSNLTAQLNKLPEIANNVKRRMSDLKAQSKSSVFASEDDLDDLGEEHYVEDDIQTNSRRTGAAAHESNRLGNRSHTGPLLLYSKKKKAFLTKWCILGNGSFKWFNDDMSLAIPKETVSLSSIFSISKRTEHSAGQQGEDIHCFEISAISSKDRFELFKFGAISASERDTWADKIVQALTSRLSNFSMLNCKRLGWCFLKQGFAGNWSLTWLYLSNRYLYYSLQDSMEFDRIHLKKTKDVFLRKDSKNLNVPEGFTKHSVLVCDFNDRSLYLLFGVVNECDIWTANIKEIAFTNSNVLSDQQVTHEEIPVIVDKCIKFVYSHGVMTEGIYRLAGVNTKINKLLSEFRSNAWSVQISREHYSEHDVANVLKRFIRQLNEPLLTERLRDHFLAVVKLTSKEERIQRYKDLLSQLPEINYNTCRKLLSHLFIVSEQQEKNLMPVNNLAPLWGPNILTVEGCQQPHLGHNLGETEVCADLITHYRTLFSVSEEEMGKEKRMIEVLEKINFPTPESIKRSGDIKTWCYLGSRTAGPCVSLSLQPSLTAGDARLQVANDGGWSAEDLEATLLHEIVLGEALERPLHHSEKILDLTLRWGTWEDDERRNNYLLLKRNSLYREAMSFARPGHSIHYSEVFFADAKTKGKFVKSIFGITNARVTQYKEEKNGHEVEVATWNVEDIVWYIGCEKKRHAPHPLNITFLLKEEAMSGKFNQGSGGNGGAPTANGSLGSSAASAHNSASQLSLASSGGDRGSNGGGGGLAVMPKPQRYFGRVLSFQSRELFIGWLAALLVAEHSADLDSNAPLLHL